MNLLRELNSPLFAVVQRPERIDLETRKRLEEYDAKSKNKKLPRQQPQRPVAVTKKKSSTPSRTTRSSASRAAGANDRENVAVNNKQNDFGVPTTDLTLKYFKERPKEG